MACAAPGHASGMSDDQPTSDHVPEPTGDDIDQLLEDAEGGIEGSLLDAPDEPEATPT